jgi:hypothetical protein
VIVESLDVRKDAVRGAPAAGLCRLCRCRGCLWVVEVDERLGTAPVGCCTVVERLRGTVETGVRRPDPEASRIGFSRILAVCVQVGDSILRVQVSLCRQLMRLAGSR